MNQHIQSGVWARSTPEAYERYVIFCVGQCPIKIAAFKSWAIGRFGFKPLVGCYKGQMEQSFITNEKHLPEIEPWIAEEESILHLSAGLPRFATLKYRDGLPLGHLLSDDIPLGHFTAVGRDYALKQPSWTFDPATGEYFVCI